MAAPEKSSAHVFDLKAVQNFPPLAKIPAGQMVLPEPDIVGNLFNDEIVVRTPTGERSTAFQAKWPDTLTRVLQSRIVQSFENANYLKVLGRQPKGSKNRRSAFRDLRSFRLCIRSIHWQQSAFPRRSSEKRARFSLPGFSKLAFQQTLRTKQALRRPLTTCSARL